MRMFGLSVKHTVTLLYCICIAYRPRHFYNDIDDLYYTTVGNKRPMSVNNSKIIRVIRSVKLSL